MSTKRTAGERRYRALKIKANDAICKLEYLQSRMLSTDAEGKQLKQIYIMQQITETIERLRHE